MRDDQHRRALPRWRWLAAVSLMAALTVLVAACEADEAADDDVDDDPAEGDEPDDDADPDEEEPDDDSDDDEAAGDWEPEGEVTMIVPFAAGGGSDLLGRAIVEAFEELEPDLDFVVENLTGGSGAVGYASFLEQEGDPHYLLAAEVMRSMLPFVEEVPFDYDTWTDVGMFAEDVGYIVVDADSEWDDIEEFIEDAEEATEAGEPLRVGVPAAAGVDELTVFQLAQEAGVEFERPVYDGTGETNPALLAGDIDATVVNPSDGRDELEAGEFRALVGFGTDRLDEELFEDVPVAPEQDWEVTATKYRGLIAPPGIPEEAEQYWVDLFEQFPETEAYDNYMSEALLAENMQLGGDWRQWLEDEWHPAVFDDLEEMTGDD
ncbi:tripartite tricarboxylate transporter substrate binding protein [Egibacter rhizosphaerae]|uniref:Tripartite tricarboxylate transporter substrate binding protein n=1 Tax=Egibacter rhizosphaerae TaxID=1670831 RepID=A0A411YBK1_9ACTN|nr:tripartite tricarboxylate transporter substrate binding protein [Egibacter rhizosphaerae]QBI18566.1 tripartite tricarboxylate transporter substrate binding protein [Egibacter rhizosphaerae]